MIGLFCAFASQSIAQSPLYNCTIKPSEVIEISSVVGGVVAEVLVKRGQVVNAGDPILKLDNDLAVAELAIAEKRAALTARIDAAQAETATRERQIERLRAAFNKGAISLSEIEDAELALVLSRNAERQQRQELDIFTAEAERARIEVEKATITSPKAGVIGEDLAREGENITGQIVATLTVTEPMRIEAFVPVSATDGVGQASFIIDGRPVARGHISFDYLAPTANLSSGTISAFYHLSDTEITPGQSCKMKMPNS